MAAKLGSSDVSFRLGSATPAAVYLGSQEVWSAVPAAATLYFNGAVDGAWTTVGNWWLDDEHTQAAGRLPTSADSVVARATLNTGSAKAVVDFSMIDEFTAGFTFGGTLAVSGIASFIGDCQTSATITGNATFSGGALNSGPISGNATFNDFSVNAGSVAGTATFNDSACNTTAFGGGTAGAFVPNPPPACP
jgi:hypothetical protein